MSATRKSALSVAVVLILVAAGAWTWLRYARAWDLGGSSPILSYDAAQYAVAARELADHGRPATPFALPLDLSHHAQPPWPLSLVQPGLVVTEAVLFKLSGTSAGAPAETREWLALVLPLLCYLGLAVLLAVGVASLVIRLAPDAGRLGRVGGLVVGLAFLLDPEAQHFAVGGFTELPFTLGLSVALIAIANGWAARRPLLFGLVLGVTGAFRANMLWLAPLLALCAAWTSDPGRRFTTVARVMAGYAVPLAPWWIYKWIAFGTPAWDLSWISLWDGVGGRTWFTLNHLPELPELPRGAAAVQAIATKVARNVPVLLLELARGPRALWLGALAITLAVVRADRERVAIRAAGVAAFAVLASSVLVTAVSVPISRYLFPARIPAEAAGLVALGILVARAPVTMLGDVAKRIAWIGVAVLAIGWGAFRTIEGWDGGIL